MEKLINKLDFNNMRLDINNLYLFVKSQAELYVKLAVENSETVQEFREYLDYSSIKNYFNNNKLDFILCDIFYNEVIIYSSDVYKNIKMPRQ